MPTPEEIKERSRLNNAFLAGERIFGIKFRHNCHVAFVGEDDIRREGWIVSVGPRCHELAAGSLRGKPLPRGPQALTCRIGIAGALGWRRTCALLAFLIVPREPSADGSFCFRGCDLCTANSSCDEAAQKPRRL